MKCATILSLMLCTLFVPKTSYANCVSHQFVVGYCYFGLPQTVGDSAISIKPRQFGFEASTVVEVKRRENIQLAVICDNGPLPVQNFVHVSREEKRIISEERYKEEDAVADVKAEYQRLRTRISNYLCEDFSLKDRN